MKGRFSNEQGAALTLVLLTIAVIGIFSTLLAFQITSTGKQVQQSTKHVQAESLAVMGQDWIHNYVKNKIDQRNNIEKDDLNNKRSFNDGYYFHVEWVDFSETIDSNETIIEYRSTGVAEDVEEVINGEVILNKNETNAENWIEIIMEKKEEQERKLQSYQRFNNCVQAKGSHEEDSYFPQGICIETGGNRGMTMQGENLWIEDKVRLQGSSYIRSYSNFTYLGGDLSITGNASKIHLKGDVYIAAELFNSNPEDHLNIYIDGNAYFDIPPEDPKEFKDICVTGETNVPSFKDNTCNN